MFRIWKSFLHKSCRSHRNLQLSCFSQNLNLSLTYMFFLLNLLGRAYWVWADQARIFVKTEAFGILFLKTVYNIPRIFHFLQLCSFDFSQIRPLRTSKSCFQITAQFWSETGSFYFGWFLCNITCTLSWTVKTMSLRQACSVLRNVFIIMHSFLIHIIFHANSYGDLHQILEPYMQHTSPSLYSFIKHHLWVCGDR